MVEKTIPENTRMAIFRDLVAIEDGGKSPSEAREEVAVRYDISPEQVRAISNEGLDKTWPPLENCD